MSFTVPARVVILGQPWRVDVGAVESGDEGETWYGRRVITVQAALPRAARPEVFHHELLHAIIKATGLGRRLEKHDGDLEEHIVETISPVQYDCFKRNKIHY